MSRRLEFFKCNGLRARSSTGFRKLGPIDWWPALVVSTNAAILQDRDGKWCNITAIIKIIHRFFENQASNFTSIFYFETSNSYITWCTWCIETSFPIPEYKGALNPQAHGQNSFESERTFHGGDNVIIETFADADLKQNIDRMLFWNAISASTVIFGLQFYRYKSVIITYLITQIILLFNISYINNFII